MSEQVMINEQTAQVPSVLPPVEEEAPVSLKQQMLFGAGTLVTGGIVDVCAHGGLPGLGIAAIISYVGWKHGPELIEGVHNRYDALDPRAKATIDRWTRWAREGRTAVIEEEETTSSVPDQSALVDDVQQESITPKVAPLPQPTPTYDDLDTHMDFGPTLRPHADKVLSGRKVLFGVSDAGKSNNLAVILEEIARFGTPLFLFDTEGEYKSLVDKKYLPTGLHITRDQIKPEQAYNFAQWALHGLRQVVIDLSTYSDAEAAWMMINVIKGVKDFEEAHDVRLPCELLLEEASVWLPQNQSQSTIAKVMVDDPEGETVDDEGSPKPVSLLSILERSFFSVVVRRGRKRGMGFTLATQRPAELNKSAMSASWIFFMRQTQAVDFKLYKEFGITPEETLSLKQGEAMVFQAGKLLERHQFRLRHSPHGANTPGLAELRQHQQGTTAATKAKQPHQSDRSGRREMPVTPLPVVEPLNEIEDDRLVQSVLEMIRHGYGGKEICNILHLDRADYRVITDHLLAEGLIDRRTSPASQAGSVPASAPTSIAKKNDGQENAAESRNEAARRGTGSEKSNEAETSEPSALSEREIEIVQLFFQEKQGMGAIVRHLYPGTIGGDRYAKASNEVNEAIRKYMQLKEG